MERVRTTTHDNPLLGKVRAYWLGTVVCCAGFLFGYDSGIVGTVIGFKTFQTGFGYTTKQAPRNSSLTVSLQQLGAFVGCFLVWPVTHRLGRKWTLAVCSFIFCLGVVMEIPDSHHLPVFLVGRVVAGLGLGGATVITPMYNSEMAPKNLRGRVGCFFQWFYTIGILVSYWLGYGMSKHLSKAGAKQWQIPIALQIVPAAGLGLGVLTLKESARWLTQKGRHQEAWESLVWIRASDASYVQEEMTEIRAGVELEQRATEGLTLKELTQGRNLRLLGTAFWVFLAQQSTGATAFAYYAPLYFKLLINGDANKNLLITGFFGAVKVIACGFFVFFLAERVGRRKALICGAIGMAACHISASAIVKTHPATGQATPYAEGTVALIYLFVMIYNMSWGGLPWPYVSEIFPTRIREPGIAVGVASQWLFAFVYTLATPYMIASLSAYVLLFWGLMNVVIAITSYFILKETRGKSLEEIGADAYGNADLLHAKTAGYAPSTNSGYEHEVKGGEHVRARAV